LVAPLTIGVGSDHNFLVVRTDPNEKLLVLSLPPSIQPGAPDIRPKILDDNFFQITLPKIAYANESRRHDLTLSYQPEFELYQHNSDQNGMNQEATASFNYFFKRNMQISVGDIYRQSHDPARTLQNVFLLLPRSRYSDNTFQASFEVQPNQLTSFGVRY